MPLPLEPCPSCHRHVRAESACPFCAAPIDARRTVARVAIVVALTAGGVAAAAACAQPQAALYGGPPPNFDRGDDAAAPPGSDPGKPPVDPSPTATQPRGPAALYGAPPPPERP